MNAIAIAQTGPGVGQIAVPDITATPRQVIAEFAPLLIEYA
jgi:hypothetical protein